MQPDKFMSNKILFRNDLHLIQIPFDIDDPAAVTENYPNYVSFPDITLEISVT